MGPSSKQTCALVLLVITCLTGCSLASAATSPASLQAAVPQARRLLPSTHEERRAQRSTGRGRGSASAAASASASSDANADARASASASPAGSSVRCTQLPAHVQVCEYTNVCFNTDTNALVWHGEPDAQRDLTGPCPHDKQETCILPEGGSQWHTMRNSPREWTQLPPRARAATTKLPINSAFYFQLANATAAAPAFTFDEPVYYVHPDNQFMNIWHHLVTLGPFLDAQAMAEANELPFPAATHVIYANKSYALNDWGLQTLKLVSPDQSAQLWFPETLRSGKCAAGGGSAPCVVCAKQLVASGRNYGVFATLDGAREMRTRGYRVAGGRSNQPCKVLVVDRLNSRRLIHGDDVFMALAGIGHIDVSVIFIETMTFAEQVQAFSSASVVVAGHGAAGANTIFMNEQSVFIEIYHHVEYDPCIERLAQNVGLIYYQLEAPKFFPMTQAWYDSSFRANKTFCEHEVTHFEAAVGIGACIHVWRQLPHIAPMPLLVDFVQRGLSQANCKPTIR